MARAPVVSLTFNIAGNPAFFDRGDIELPKGQKAMGLVLKLRATIANSDAAPHNLDPRELLERIRITRMNYGKEGEFEPYASRTLREYLDHVIRCYGIYAVSQFIDQQGNAQSIACAPGNTAIELELPLPLGKFLPFDDATNKDRWGMGRSQLLTLRGEFKREGPDAIDANLSLTGQVNIDIDPDAVPTKGDVWNPVPVLLFNTDTHKAFNLPDGLPLAFDVMSGTPLTSISFHIDDAEIHDHVSQATAAAELLRQRPLGALFFATFDGKPVYDVALTGQRFEDVHTGAPMFRQDIQDLVSLPYRYTYLPIVTEEEEKKIVINAANSKARNKALKLVSESVLRGDALPVRLAPYAGRRLVDNQDREWQLAPGHVSAPGATKSQIDIPASVQNAAKAAVTQLRAAGDVKAAEGVINALAAQVPGAVNNGRGFSAGVTATRNLIASKVAG